MLARRSKRAILAFIGLSLLVGVLLASVSRYFEGVESRRRLQDEKASLKQREDFVFTVEPRTVERERRYAVAVDPWMVSDVPAEVAGRVSETKVEPGSRVKKGDPLVLLDDEIAASDLRRAEAQLAELQRLLAEAETLERSKVVSRTQVEAVRSEARVADAAEDSARARFEDHTIRAPYDGDVVERFVQIGEAVNINQRVVRLVDTSRLRVVFMSMSATSRPSLPARKFKSVCPSRRARCWKHRSSTWLRSPMRTRAFSGSRPRCPMPISLCAAV